jgi:hypothetical protein
VDVSSTTEIVTFTGICGSQETAIVNLCNLKNGMVIAKAKVPFSGAECVCKHLNRKLASFPGENDIYSLKSLMEVDFDRCFPRDHSNFKLWVNGTFGCKALIQRDDGRVILPQICSQELPVLCQ